MGDIIDQNAADEATDIVRNKANPKYEAYHRNDQRVVDYVSELFRRADPSFYDPADSRPPALRTPPDGKKADGSQPGGDSSQAEAENANAEEDDPMLDQALRSDPEFGQNFDENMVLARELFQTEIRNGPAILDRAKKTFSREDNVAAMRLLAKLGKLGV